MACNFVNKNTINNAMQKIIIETDAFDDLLEQTKGINSKLDKLLSQEPKPSPWLTIEEASSMLGVGKRTLKNYRDKGILPFSKNKGKIYFKREDINKYLENYYVNYEGGES